MKNNIYILYIVVVGIFISSCEKQKALIFDEKPSFSFTDSIISVGMGFISENEILQNIGIKLTGNLPKEDIKLKLLPSGDAIKDVDFVVPKTVVFPKGKDKGNFDIKILKSKDLESFKEGKTLCLEFVEENFFVPAFIKMIKIKIYGGIPNEWIGQTKGNAWNFTYTIGKCSKAKYIYFYQKLGFADFTKLPEYGTWNLYSKLRVYKSYLNQQIALDNQKRQSEGLETLKDDDGKTDLKF